MSAIGLEPATFKMVVSSVIHQATAIQKEIASELAHNIQLQRQVPKNLPDRNSGQGQRGQRLNPLFADNYIIEFLVCYNSHRLFPYRKLMSAIGLEPATFKMVVSSVIHQATAIQKEIASELAHNIQLQRLLYNCPRIMDSTFDLVVLGPSCGRGDPLGLDVAIECCEQVPKRFPFVSPWPNG